MKNAIITLIVIFVLVLVVLPLVFISFGKLKNPVDMISSSITSQTYANQNYVPDASDPTDPSQQPQSVFDVGLEARCKASSTVLQFGDVLTTTQSKPISLLSASSTAYNFAWTLAGLWSPTPKALDARSDVGDGFGLIGGTASNTQAIIGLTAMKFTDPACATYYNRIFPIYHDSGRVLTEGGWDKKGLSLREKGLITIQGLSYYWYAFDVASSIVSENTTADASSTMLSINTSKRYFILFSAYKNAVMYNVAFVNSLNDGTYRNFLNIATGYVGRLQLR